MFEYYREVKQSKRLPESPKLLDKEILLYIETFYPGETEFTTHQPLSWLRQLLPSLLTTLSLELKKNKTWVCNLLEIDASRINTIGKGKVWMVPSLQDLCMRLRFVLKNKTFGIVNIDLLTRLLQPLIPSHLFLQFHDELTKENINQKEV